MSYSFQSGCVSSGNGRDVRSPIKHAIANCIERTNLTDIGTSEKSPFADIFSSHDENATLLAERREDKHIGSVPNKNHVLLANFIYATPFQKLFD